jgi:23S rRNA (guanosine2251-2'-O)-methyltransferase
MENEKNFVFGINPVLEKLRAAPKDVWEILIAEGSERPALRSIDAEAKRLGVRVIHAPSSLLSRLAKGQRHQGVLAKIAPYSYLNFVDLAQRLASFSGSQWILILDGLTDPRNFGALLRTAEAVGIQNVVIPKDRSVDVTSTVVTTSAGAVHHLKIYKATNLRRAAATLKEHGFWMVGLDPQSVAGIYDHVYPEKLGIVLGSEGKGIRPLILRECDFLVSIPMKGKVASLNVGVAGAVFLYEILRQKRSIDKVGAKR